MEHEIWTERWRPKTFDDLVVKNKTKLRKMLESNKSIQHLLLYSKSGGTGKGSIFNVMEHTMGSNVKKINASESTGIGIIRDTVLDYVSTKSLFADKRKLIFLDEVDGLSSQAMKSLKGIMEQFQSNAIFVLSTNMIEKIPDPIKSRCLEIDLKNPNRAEIKKRLQYICEQEKVDIEEEALKKLIMINYPDMRAMIKSLQDLSHDGTKKITYNEIIEPENNSRIVWKLVCENKVSEARLFWIKENLDLQKLVIDFYKFFISDFENHKQEVRIFTLLCKYQYEMATGGNHELEMMALSQNISSIIRDK